MINLSKKLLSLLNKKMYLINCNSSELPITTVIACLISTIFNAQFPAAILSIHLAHGCAVPIFYMLAYD